MSLRIALTASFPGAIIPAGIFGGTPNPSYVAVVDALVTFQLWNGRPGL